MIATLEYMTYSDIQGAFSGTVSDVDAPPLSEDADAPILIGSDGDLLDGFHRVAGYLAALASDEALAEDDLRVVIVSSDDVAAIIAEPGRGQQEAIALAYAMAGVEI